MFENTLNRSLRGIILRLFDIRSGEFKRVVLMQLTIFLLISTLLIIKPTITSLFLSDVGIKKLPLAFILVAVVAGFITTFYSRILNSVPLNKIIHSTLLISVILITVFSVLLRLNLVDKWVLYFFYVWVMVFGVLATSQFWLLANIVFNSREAKRLFSLIGGAAIGGGIMGGYLTSIFAPILGSENLLFVGVIFLIICIPLTRNIWYGNQLQKESVFKRKTKMGKVSEHPFHLIIKSKHLKYLALITAISVLVAKLVDYQFNAISSQKITNEDELTAFFGFWFSNFNLISLLIQLFITRRVVGTYGVGVSLFFLPVGILAGVIAIIITPALWAAVLIKASDASLKQSVNRSAIELLALPIPSETKKQAKTFIDVFVDSFATGLSGILLITLINGFNIPLKYVSLLIVVLLFIWFRLVIKVRTEYLSLFKKKLNLHNEPLKNKGLILDVGNQSVYKGLSSVLENGTEKQILYILKNTDDLHHERLLNSIQKLLKHPSPAIVAEAIKKLYDYKSENLSNEIKQFTKSADIHIKIAAIEYLIEHAEKDRIELIQHYITSSDEVIKHAALMAFAIEANNNPDLRKEVGLSEIIREKLKEAESLPENEESDIKKIRLLRLIGTANLPEHYHFITKLLKDSNFKLRSEAILTAGMTYDMLFIPTLLSFLEKKEEKHYAVKAISNYGFKIIVYLSEQIRNNNFSVFIVRGIPEIVENIGTQNGIDFLFELLEYNDIIVRNNVLLSLTRLKNKQPHLVFYNKRIIHNIFDEAKMFLNTLAALHVQQERISNQSNEDTVFEARKSLIQLLERRLDDNLLRIFKFLGLKYPPEEIDSLYRDIKSDKSEMRVNAIEFLDNILDTNLKKTLIPIIETTLSDSITKEIINELRIKVMSQGECFSMLLEGKDVKVKLAVLYLLSVLKDKRYIPIVNTYINHPNKKISSWALNAMNAMNESGEKR